MQHWGHRYWIIVRKESINRYVRTNSSFWCALNFQSESPIHGALILFGNLDCLDDHFYCSTPRMIIFVVDLSFQGATVFKFTTHFVCTEERHSAGRQLSKYTIKIYYTKYNLDWLTDWLTECSDNDFQFHFGSCGCFYWPGAWPQSRLRPWQLLPSNRRSACWSRKKPEGLIHLWVEEERALLHRQSSAGRALWTCVYVSNLCFKSIFHCFSSYCRMKRNVLIVIRDGHMIQCITSSIIG